MWTILQIAIIGGVIWFADGQFGDAPAIIGLTFAFLATFFLSAIIDAIMGRRRPPPADRPHEGLDPRIGVMPKDHIAKPGLHGGGHDNPAGDRRGGSRRERPGKGALYPTRLMPKASSDRHC
jgi:hypothetical protein